MKPVLLFLVILIPFFGCRKAEKQKTVPEKVHEINIGILHGKIDTFTGSIEPFFPAYWHFNLLNDSVFIKISSDYESDSGITTFKGAKYPLMNVHAIIEFKEAARLTPNGKPFLFNDGKMESGTLYCFPLHVLQYRQDTSSKYFLVNAESGTFRNMIDLARRFHLKVKFVKVPVTDIGEKRLAEQLNKEDNLSIVPLPPIPVQKTIKFTPPAETH